MNALFKAMEEKEKLGEYRGLAKLNTFEEMRRSALTPEDKGKIVHSLVVYKYRPTKKTEEKKSKARLVANSSSGRKEPWLRCYAATVRASSVR